MQITKFGHACLLVEEADTRILIDPGVWSVVPEIALLDAILITHEHQDHIDIGTLKKILEKNPGAKIITHAGAGKVLTEAGIAYETIEEGQSVSINNVSIESFGHEHAVVYGTSPCQNTGFFIAEKLFVPGDALHDMPSHAVEILALPTGGPWMKMSEAIDYAKAIKPKTVFPVHDAMYTEEYKTGLVPRIVGGNFETAGIAFRTLTDGVAESFA